ELRRYILKIADIFEVAIDMFNEEKAKGDVTADISFFFWRSNYRPNFTIKSPSTFSISYPR
ncbi:hypothetical protein COM56_23945, partial [Bacillus cereus]